MYQPNPIDTTGVALGDELLALTERLAESTHDRWAQRRMADGWTWGPERNDRTKQHPCLVPYAQLPEAEKAYDRVTAMETLKSIVALGGHISLDDEPPRASEPPSSSGPR